MSVRVDERPILSLWLLIAILHAVVQIIPIQSDQIDVLLCYIPDTLNGEITIRDSGLDELPSAVLPGTRIDLHCNKGFGSSTASAVCLDNGLWSNDIGRCQRRRSVEIIDKMGCPMPQLENGEIVAQTRELRVGKGGSYLPGAKIQIACYAGYELKDGAEDSVCLPDGNWTNVVGRCEPAEFLQAFIRHKGEIIRPADLPFPPSIQQLQQQQQQQQQQQLPQLALVPMPPPPPAKLAHQSQLKPHHPHLQPHARNGSVSCHEYPTIAYGAVMNGLSHPTAQRKIVCYSGFTLMGVDIAICGDNGKWIFNGICAKDCGPAPHIQNGFIVSGSFSIGTTRKIECSNGFTLVGPNVITCKDDSLWTKPGVCGRTQLFLIAGSFTFDEAVVACEEAGGKLASVKTCSDDALIKSLMLGGEARTKTSNVPIKNAWIGLRRASKQSPRWRWVGSGEYLDNFSFKGWWPSYPDNKDTEDDCVIYQTWNDFAVGWNDIPCGSRTWISSDIRIPYAPQNVGAVCEKNYFSDPPAKP